MRSPVLVLPQRRHVRALGNTIGRRRRKLFRLTDKGAAQMAKLDTYTAGISAVYERLFEETGNTHAVLLKTLQALEDRPLRARAAD